MRHVFGGGLFLGEALGFLGGFGLGRFERRFLGGLFWGRALGFLGGFWLGRFETRFLGVLFLVGGFGVFRWFLVSEV